jgi:hypothetical protein
LVKAERREALKKDGVLYRDGSIPDRPKGDWHFHQDILGGYVKLSTVHRWRMKGCRGVRLETFLRGGVRHTTREAIERFFEAVIPVIIFAFIVKVFVLVFRA